MVKAITIDSNENADWLRTSKAWKQEQHIQKLLEPLFDFPSEIKEAGRRVQAARVKQVKDIIKAWQKLRTELDDWLKWAEYMDGDWVEAPNIRVKEEDMQELFGHHVTISGTRVFIQEKAQFASRD